MEIQTLTLHFFGRVSCLADKGRSGTISCKDPDSYQSELQLTVKFASNRCFCFPWISESSTTSRMSQEVGKRLGSVGYNTNIIPHV